MTKRARPIDIAKKLNISTSSLRNYEAKGIVPPSDRLPNGYRVYTEEHFAYFKCIIAMSPGFGMNITAAVLKFIQQKDLAAALWIINQAQATNAEDKQAAENLLKLLDQVKEDVSIQTRTMTIGEVSRETRLPISTLRFWEKEGFISPIRDKKNTYRYFDIYQFIKIGLLNAIKNVEYSAKTVQIKKNIMELEPKDLVSAEQLVYDIQNQFNKRNKEQFHGLHYLYQLCAKLNLDI